MKKIFLSLILLLLAIPGFSQVVKPVKLDSLVTVSLPPGYQKKDTLGEQIFSANGLFGYMVAIREANAKNNAPLKKARDLNKVLKDYIKGIQGQASDGSAQNVRDTTIGALKAKIFTLQSDVGGDDVEYRNILLLYTQDATYTFEYVYPENRKDLVKDEYKAYIASIHFSPGLQRNDQYLSSANGLSTINQIEIFGGGGLLIIVVIVLIARRKRRLVIS
jgi:hypothetical protein